MSGHPWPELREMILEEAKELFWKAMQEITAATARGFGTSVGRSA